MPLKSIRSLDEELLERLVRSIPTRRLMGDTGKAHRKIYFRYFKGYRPEKISRKKIFGAVMKEVVQGGDEIFAGILAIAWNDMHWKLYEAMRKQVATINEDVEAIERIEDEKAAEIVEALIADFDTEDIYICTILNEVRFSPEFKAELNPTGGAPVWEAPEEEAAEEEAAATEDAPATEETKVGEEETAS